MTFMSMVKHAAITKTDDRRGFDLTEASSGNSRVHLCNTCDIARLKPAVSFMTHRSPVDFLHSYEKGDIALDVLTAECYKDTTSGTRTSWVLPWQNQFSGFSRPSCITGPFNTVAHLTSTSRPDPHHSHTSLLLTTLNLLTATQYPGPSYFTQNHDPPHLHSTPRPTSLSLNTQTLLTSTHQPDPSHFSTQRHEFPPTDHMKTLNFNCIELGLLAGVLISISLFDNTASSLVWYDNLPRNQSRV